MFYVYDLGNIEVFSLSHWYVSLFISLTCLLFIKFLSLLFHLLLLSQLWPIFNFLGLFSLLTKSLLTYSIAWIGWVCIFTIFEEQRLPYCHVFIFVFSVSALVFWSLCSLSIWISVLAYHGYTFMPGGIFFLGWLRIIKCNFFALPIL